MPYLKLIFGFFLLAFALIAFLFSPITAKTSEAHLQYCGFDTQFGGIPIYPLDSNTLPPPTVTTTANGQQITVSWTATTGCYSWEEQPDITQWPALRHYTTATSVTFTGTANTTYQPQVSSVQATFVTFWGYCCNIGHPSGWNHTISKNPTVGNTVTTAPPFIITSVTAGACDGGPTQPVTINWSGTPAGTTSFSIQRGTVSTSVSEIDTVSNGTALSYIDNGPVRPPSPGTYYYLIQARPSFNHTGLPAPGVSVTACAPPQPDLVIENPSSPPVNAITDDSLTFTATVANRGTAAATSTSWTRLTIDGIGVDPDAPTSALGVNGTENNSWSWTATTGTHIYQFCADFLNEVIESNESNNCSLPRSFTVFPLLTASCSVSPTTATLGQNVTWTAFPSGGTGSYTYSWSGTDGLSGSTNPISRSYSTPGPKTASVTVTSGSQNTGPVSCSNSVTVTAPLPWIQTTGGDVHSDTRIDTPGGP